MNQWERVEAMEEDYIQAAAALKTLEKALNRTQAVLPRLQALNAYLGSPEWYQDRATDAAGDFPPDLRRGVLTEDTIYDLLTDYRDLAERSRALLKDL